MREGIREGGREEGLGRKEKLFLFFPRAGLRHGSRNRPETLNLRSAIPVRLLLEELGGVLPI